MPSQTTSHDTTNDADDDELIDTTETLKPMTTPKEGTS